MELFIYFKVRKCLFSPLSGAFKLIASMSVNKKILKKKSQQFKAFSMAGIAFYFPSLFLKKLRTTECKIWSLTADGEKLQIFV